MRFDVDAIAAQVKAALSELSQSPSGEAGELFFFNIRNTTLHAELHMRNGQLAYLGVHSTAELALQRKANDARDEARARDL